MPVCFCKVEGIVRANFGLEWMGRECCKGNLVMVRVKTVLLGFIDVEVIYKIWIITQDKVKDVSTDVSGGGYKLRKVEPEDEVTEEICTRRAS